MIERALIVDEPWIGMILAGEKIWEMRSRRTNIRGRIGLIRKGSGCVVGGCEIVDCFSNFNLQQLEENYDKHRIKDTGLFDIWPIAWVIANANRYDEPIPYVHPLGAVTWVKVSL